MSDITWNDLPADEQELMRGALPDGYSPDTNMEMARCDSLARKGLVVETRGEYTLTDAGRALLPAGEAVDVPTMGYAAAQNLAQHKAFIARPIADESEDEMDALQADLAAALARAQAAEGDEAEKMAVEYGDGYAAGMVDGVHDLHEAITLAIATADISQRLPAVKRVLAEYELMYLKSAETE